MLQLMNQKEEYWKKKFDREQVSRRLAEERYRNAVSLFRVTQIPKSNARARLPVTWRHLPYYRWILRNQHR